MAENNLGANVETLYDFFWGNKQKNDKMKNLLSSLKGVADTSRAQPAPSGFLSGAQMSGGMEPTEGAGYDPLEMFSKRNRDMKTSVMEKILEQGYSPGDKSIEPILKMFDDDWQQDSRGKKFVNEDLYGRKGQYLQDSYDLKGEYNRENHGLEAGEAALERDHELDLEGKKNSYKMGQIDRTNKGRYSVETLRGKNRSTRHGGVSANDFYSGKYDPEEVTPELLDYELENIENDLDDLEDDRPDGTSDWSMDNPELYKIQLDEYKTKKKELKNIKKTLRYSKSEQLRRGTGENPIKKDLGPSTKERAEHDRGYKNALDVIAKGPSDSNYKNAVKAAQNYRKRYGVYK